MRQMSGGGGERRVLGTMREITQVRVMMDERVAPVLREEFSPPDHADVCSSSVGSSFAGDYGLHRVVLMKWTSVVPQSPTQRCARISAFF